MEVAINIKRLGKRLKVGETFVSTTNRMMKKRESVKGNTYEVLRSGDIKTFVKGNRSYLCKVIALVETRTGLHHWMHSSNGETDNYDPWEFTRWWQFSYLVRIIEN